MISDAPRFQTSDAERLAREVFGWSVVAQVLPSERDQNFLLVDDAGVRRILKIANAAEDPRLLDAQQHAMRHVAARVAACPTPIPTRSGDDMATTRAPDGREHRVWAITHLPGAVLATRRHRSASLLHHFGRTIAELGHALADFDHPAAHRAFHWDLAQARHVVEQHRGLIRDSELGAAIDTIVAGADARLAAILPSLPRQIVHGDLNDHNVLVTGSPLDDGRISGVIDFGDMTHSFAIADLAIAGAYLMLDAADPLTTLATLVRGHAAVRVPGEPELSALFGLAALRLCASACIAAHQSAARPDNLYLDVSQSAIRRTLPALARVPFALAEAMMREAAGLEPSPTGGAVHAWLAGQTAHAAPILPHDLRTQPSLVLDLSVGSPLASADPDENAASRLTPRIDAAMAAASVPVGIGRYDEPRLLYSSSLFAGDTAPLAERRTIHLGLDLFAEAGTPVAAPLRGTVHAFADNRAALDYGPVIILRHETDDGTPFFTLYGHLSRESLDGLETGRTIERGERFASLGDARVNGGWTPHLHFQLFTDLLDLGTDVPGVGPASQRAAWRSISPDPNLLVGIPAEYFPPAEPPKDVTLATRQRLFGRNLSVAYREPLRIVRGWRQWLFDDTGRRYLDAYNNVPHVGHAHPRVVAAGQRQMALLNTNTRYLSDVVNQYAERLTATFPEPLRVCYLVSSASEANELALRMARAYTRARDMIVLEAAYHGNTTTLIDLSPYKHAGPGGTGAPDWVHAVPIPDVYRGELAATDPGAGAGYAAHVATAIDRIRAQARVLAGFIAETCPSVGGQILLPDGYLAEVYRHVRAAGGVCIADEVQTGLGRMGTSFWAFESHGVVPDIVVLGKPLGNGHPIGAVVTTREIATSFDTGMEYFSTFGGNTVSCAIGTAVLDVMRDERLQDHARRVGEHMLALLRRLAERHALIGDVRGSGLFIGVELVRDRETREPAGREASWVANRMREMGVLLGTDGPYHNVVKIRPPMPFDESDAAVLAEAFDRALEELASGG